MRDKNIIFVGAWPAPYGGVAEYTRRVFDSMEGDIFHAILRSKTQINFSYNIKKIFCSFNLTFVAVLLCKKIIYKKFFHFDFSTPLSLYLLSLLPRRSKNIIALHNGELIFSRIKLFRDIQISVLRSAKYVIALNDDHRDLYISLLPGSKNVIRMSSYIKPYGTRAASEKIYDVFVSGYPVSNYNFDLVYDLAIKNPNLKFCLVFYGEDFSKSRFKSIYNNNIDIFYDIDPKSFLSLISKSKVLLRPTTIDSVGIAVCDAVYFGLQVVATNCCNGPDGTIIIDKDNLDDNFNSKGSLSCFIVNSLSVKRISGRKI